MAFENEKDALEKALEAQTALQREFIDALFRVAEKYDADPTQLAMQVSQMSHTMFQPLHLIHQERMMARHSEMTQHRPPEKS